jgi:putative selenate reductase
MDAEIARDHTEFTGESAIKEASRCLFCGDVCSVCVTVCPNRANNYYLTQAAEVPIWKVDFTNEKPTFEIESYLKVEQKYQVLNVSDFCNECGNCTTFCPTKGSPFSDKPRFCLTKKSFNQTENGFFLNVDGATKTLFHRKTDSISKLVKTANMYQFRDEEIEIDFDLTDFQIVKIETLKPINSKFNLKAAAEMKVLIDSVNPILS